MIIIDKKRFYINFHAKFPIWLIIRQPSSKSLKHIAGKAPIE